MSVGVLRSSLGRKRLQPIVEILNKMLTGSFVVSEGGGLCMRGPRYDEISVHSSVRPTPQAANPLL